MTISAMRRKSRRFASDIFASPNGWQLAWLLRARHDRPFNRPAAEKRDEVASFQLIELHLVPPSQGRIAEYRIGEEQSAGYTRLFTLGRGPGRRSRFAERRSFAPQ
jgi:hypothetical protein